MKMPKPVGAYEEVVGTEEWQGFPSEIIEMRDAYSAEQMKQYGRDLLEAAAHIAEGYPKYGDGIGEDIRKLKETL